MEQRGLKLVAGAAMVCWAGSMGGCITATVAAAAAQFAPGIAAVMGDTYERTGSRIVPAEYEGLAGEDFAVLVQADLAIQANHPRAVNVLTNAITRRLAAEEVGATGMVPGPRVREFQYTNPSWEAMSFADVADEFTVSRLVVVDLYEYRLFEPGNSHIWDGRVAVNVGVVEADGAVPDDFSFARELRVSYPDGSRSVSELSEEHVEAVLQQRIIDRVSWLFYEHEEPNAMRY